MLLALLFVVSVTFFNWSYIPHIQYLSLMCTRTFTHPDRKLAEQNIHRIFIKYRPIYRVHTSTMQEIISTISKLCENTPAYDIIDSDVHMCIGRGKKTPEWDQRPHQSTLLHFVFYQSVEIVRQIPMM